MGSRVAVVYVVAGEPTTGLWCPRCMLPSGVEVPLKTLSWSGVGDFGVLRQCFDCGARLKVSVSEL